MNVTPLERLENLKFAAHVGHGSEYVLLPQGVLTVIKNSTPDTPMAHSHWVYQWDEKLHGANSKVIPQETAVGLLAWKWSSKPEVP